MKRRLFFYAAVLVGLGCRSNSGVEDSGAGNVAVTANQKFRLLAPEQSGIRFVNALNETQEFNYFTYPFVYFGGGVAIGDVNNDSLPDIYLSSNMGQNALYLNKGQLRFEDITQAAGVEGVYNRWTTGVTMADVNNDGFLDMYVSVAGPNAPAERKNLLYINNQDNTFTEKAEAYGVADTGHSIQSVFFDYDNDGDLDLYVGNYPPAGFGAKTDYFVQKLRKPSADDSDKLYRNDNGHFTNVTQPAGVLNYGLTLGLSAADFNQDGWMDLYVSNDFNSPDYLYINQKNGTFRNEILNFTMHTSNFGMGTDAGDINNDGLVDLIQLDMMGSTNEQQKANMSAMNPAQFYQTVRSGLHHQYMKNTLQLNTGVNGFMEIGEMTGISYTDWSWGVLFLDMNNDGAKDIFITNGMRRNVNDNDFNAYFNILRDRKGISATEYGGLIKQIPVQPVENFSFINNKDLTFTKADSAYGLSFKGFSNGVAYADLDLDGDLDMVVNNIDRPSHVYENEMTDKSSRNYLRIRLTGITDNKNGIGAQVKIFSKNGIQYEEVMLTRGYQSSVEPVIHFGLGAVTTVDSIHIHWPKGGVQKLVNVKGNQVLHIRQNSGQPNRENTTHEGWLTLQQPTLTTEYIHKENEFDDFAREVLLPHRMSQHGPALAVGDVNGDGLDDFYVGGAKGIAGMLYIQQATGAFSPFAGAVWQKDSQHEDVDALFFDANGDKYPDLYVVSGGNEMPLGDSYYQDRLYINQEGKGFVKASLPAMTISGSCVKAADVDKDGDMDLFVGGRQIPGRYPLPESSYLLLNESKEKTVKFTIANESIAPRLSQLGMVTDAVWTDMDKDGWQDLVIVGEWMAPVLLKNNRGRLEESAGNETMKKQVGWWNSVAAADLDSDGDEDLILGNLGLNYKYKASEKEPFKIYANDFDQNGTLDIVLGYYNGGRLFPVRGRSCSSQQIPSLKKKFPTYTEFSRAGLSDVYTEAKLNTATRYEAVNFAHVVCLNEDGRFSIKKLPALAQISSVNDILVSDLNNDGKPDLFLAGNVFESEVETPRSDAGFGTLLLGDGHGGFVCETPLETGILIKGEVRKMIPIIGAKQTGFLVARNEEKLLWIRKNPHKGVTPKNSIF